MSSRVAHTPRHPAQTTRTVDGKTERQCLTDGCGWHPLDEYHFYRDKRGHWSSRCVLCERKMSRNGLKPMPTVLDRQPSSPPVLTWDALL